MYDRIIDDIITYENDEAKYEICNNSFIEILIVIIQIENM